MNICTLFSIGSEQTNIEYRNIANAFKFLLGWVVRIIDHLIKIMHHLQANAVLIVAAALQVIGLLYAIILIRKIKITK